MLTDSKSSKVSAECTLHGQATPSEGLLVKRTKTLFSINCETNYFLNYSQAHLTDTLKALLIHENSPDKLTFPIETTTKNGFGYITIFISGVSHDQSSSHCNSIFLRPKVKIYFFL